MNIFDEYLADWDFDEKWRGFVARLSAAAPGWQAGPIDLQDAAIWPGPLDRWEKLSGLTVWLDVSDSTGQPVVLTLAGALDDTGLRCGTLEPSCPNDPDRADLTWYTVNTSGAQDLDALADAFLDWLEALQRRPVAELARREREAARRRRDRR
ncbi:hypothetical protein [Kitasatospora sp. LaBMicrA B282]|uniref:hypothetical protein n=1 Tax=Kitasatospora sp. LaBMicrA B282 TaxID=3420949 RepID=UPI003D0DB3C5